MSNLNALGEDFGSLQKDTGQTMIVKDNVQVVFKDGSIPTEGVDHQLQFYDTNKLFVISQGTTFTSNALRSEKKLPFWRFPKRAMIEWAKRFHKGEKYDVARNMTHNWKLAINSDDVEFVRQFFDHAFEHLLNAKDLAEHGVEHADWEGENMFDHLGAAMWNVASLIEYLDKNPKLVCKALSQKSEPIK